MKTKQLLKTFMACFLMFVFGIQKVYAGMTEFTTRTTIEGVEVTYRIIAGAYAEVSSVPTGTVGKVTIPSTITYNHWNGDVEIEVKRVDYNAFKNCTGITSVTLPNTVESIGENAFLGCSSLVSISLPDALEELSNHLFEDCAHLTSVAIPSTVKIIGQKAFYNCRRLREITIPSSVNAIYDSAFAGCWSLAAIISEITSPFAISESVFADIDDATLYVPTNTKAAYEATAGWNTIPHIVEIYVTLSEDATTMPYTANGVDVTLFRTIAPNEWSTLVLPFNATAEQLKSAFGDDVELADFVGWNSEEDANGNIVGISVEFVSTDAILANKPVLIKTTKRVESADFKSVTLQPEDNPYVQVGTKKAERGTFHGTYVRSMVPEEQLFLSGNQFWYSTGKTQIGAFRGWFEFYDVLDDYYDASKVKFSFFIDGEYATGLGEVLDCKLRCGNDVPYNLSGQRMGTKQPGVKIVNGKKYIIK